MRRLLPILLVLAFVAEDARASCAPPNPRGQLKYADAAFDGTFVSSRREGDSVWFTFRVDRVFKGQLGETVEIYQRGVSTIYFGGFTPGERVALTMNFSNGVWLSNDCQRYDPDELADAVKPLPRPPGRGRAAYFVSGWFGNAGGLLLDRRGRTLAYAFEPVRRASVCPGGRRIAVLGEKIRLLRTRDLRVVDTANAGPTQRIHCLGRVVVRATSSGLFRGNRRIWRGTWRGIAFHRRYAYASMEDHVTRVDLVTGRERRVVELRAEGDVTVSPDGQRLAMFVAPGDVAVAEVRSGRFRTSEAGGYNSIVWTARERLALLGATYSRVRQQPSQPARFLDARLRRQGELPGWAAFAAVGLDGAVVGVAGHRVERATPAGASELGRLPGSQVSGIRRLPGIEIRASRRRPRY